jgi:hypothetical protein
MRRRRVAAGAALAAASLVSTYAAALRPAVSYASNLSRIAPRAAPLVPTCDDADVTVSTASDLRAAVASADDSVICVAQDINLSDNSGFNSGRVLIPSDVSIAIVGRTPQTTITGPTDDSYIFTSYAMTYPGDDTVTFASLTLEGGRAARGGAIRVKGWYAAPVLNRRSLVIDHVTFRDNEAANGAPTSRGGAVYGNRLRSVSITNSTFVDNSAASSGGAVFLTDIAASVVIQDSTFTHSESLGGGGGAVYIKGASTAHLEDDSFIDNDTHFTQAGTPPGGGGVYLGQISDLVEIAETNWTLNDAEGPGGALSIKDSAADIVITRSAMSGNTADDWGGGAYLYNFNAGGGDVTVSNSEFVGNTAGLYAGAMYIGTYGAAIVSGTTVSGNQAPFAAGFSAAFTNSLSVTNSTIVSNRALSSSSLKGGGGVFTRYTPVTIDFATITDNSVLGTTRGGGIHVFSGSVDDTLTITNSIVAGNAGISGSEIVTASGIPIVIDYAAITDDTSIQSSGPTSILNVIYATDSPLLLGPLQDNGGPTLTMAPGAGSSAIDAGNPAWSAPPAFDQRDAGFPRLVGTRVDMGAVEVTGAPNPTPTTTPTPVFPAGVPRDVAATAGDRSATVAWQVPTTTGSFPVSAYQVTSTPGGQSCLTTALSCTVTGLGNGTSYTFRVKALNGAGWGQESEPSNAVTPRAEPKPAIMIAGTRSGRTIAITGEATGLPSGSVVTPWTRVGLGRDFTPGRDLAVADDGTFAWSRRASTKHVVHMYVTSDEARSNVLRIARQSRN